MAEQTTQPSPSDENTNRLIAIENKLNAIENGQRIIPRRVYLFGAGLTLMIAGLTLTISKLGTTPWYGIIIFVVGALFFIFRKKIEEGLRPS